MLTDYTNHLQRDGLISALNWDATIVTAVSTKLLGANLFLVGAAKAGTTSLADYFDQHPDVFVSRPKEPNFFALPNCEPPLCRGPADPVRLGQLLLGHSITEPQAYQQLFATAQKVSIRADASVRYLYADDAAGRIHAYDSSSQIIAILRDPVARMHSHYHMNVRMGVESESFEQALRAESQRIEQQWGWDWHYVNVGRYAPQVARYVDLFGADQVLVLFYEDFCRDPVSVVQQAYRRMGVASNVRPDTDQRANVGQTPRYRFVRQLLWEDNPVKAVAKRIVPAGLRRTVSRWVEAKNRRSVPKLDPAKHRELSRLFDDDRQQLQDLLQRKLPW